VRGLYPIVDLDSLLQTGFPARDFAARVLAPRPPLLQVRAKRTSPRVTLAVLEELLPLCRSAGTLLFANDRPDLALLSGADGVHVGQDDLPPSEVRRLAPGLRVGVSTHDLDQLAAALETAPAYVAFGPVFPTSSKQNPDPVVGVAGLAEASARARSRGVPLVAIGGIDGARAPAIREAGAIGAVIGALLDPTLAGVEARARALHAALGGG
jgi:thiamine-phosphate pyrophosphorylase